MKKFIIPILFFLPFSASAQAPLSAVFNPNPLFNVSNFLPTDVTEANIEMFNYTSETQGAYIEAVNVSNDDNLASQMKLEMFENSTQIYNNNFGTFLNDGPVPLSSIGANNSKIYDLKITFLESADDSYQGKTLKFDICVGFSGGDQHCTNEVVASPENNTESNSSSGGSSGGSHLLIFNERNETPIPETTTITIHWETNKPATGQVIYGPAENNYVLDLNNLPFFGYPFGTDEDMTKVINHTMVITGLVPGIYKYRVVSRASPPTISYEHQFTVSTSFGTESVITAGPLGISGEGEILGASSQNNGTSSGDILGNENNIASVFTAGWNNLLSWWWLLLLLLLIAYFIWRFILRSRDEKKDLPDLD